MTEKFKVFSIVYIAISIILLFASVVTIDHIEDELYFTKTKLIVTQMVCNDMIDITNELANEKWGNDVPIIEKFEVDDQ